MSAGWGAAGSLGARQAGPSWGSEPDQAIWAAKPMDPPRPNRHALPRLAHPGALTCGPDERTTTRPSRVRPRGPDGPRAADRAGAAHRLRPGARRALPPRALAQRRARDGPGEPARQ